MPSRSRKPRRVAPGAAFVDTSAFIALFSQADANHAEAEAMFAHAISSRRPLLTSNLVLAEVHRLLLFRAGIRPAAAALDRITSSPSLRLHHATGTDQIRARAWLTKLDDHAITWTDAISFAIMDGSRCRSALTFDRDFWIAGFERYSVPRRAPR